MSELNNWALEIFSLKKIIPPNKTKTIVIAVAIYTVSMVSPISALKLKKGTAMKEKKVGIKMSLCFVLE